MKKKMSFDKYLLVGFSCVECNGRSRVEQLDIIKNLLKSMGEGENNLEVERKKFNSLKKEGQDMAQSSMMFKVTISQLAMQMKLQSFKDLVSLTAVLKENKKEK